MKQYEIIDHTADTGIIARGNNMAEAFGNAAAGMFSIIADVSGIKESESRAIEVFAPDLESLLVEWLNELVYIFDVDHLIFSRCDVNTLSETSLNAICYGEKYNSERHILRTGIKAATYHMLEINRRENRLRVIFDV